MPDATKDPYLMGAAPHDPVHSPAHYCHGGMEAKDVLRAFMADAPVYPMQAYWWGCALKYMLRWPYKGDSLRKRLEDIDKAIECMGLLRDTVSAQLEAQTRGEGDEW